MRIILFEEHDKLFVLIMKKHQLLLYFKTIIDEKSN